MTLQYIDLSERHGHRDDHGFACGAEFNVKTRRRVDIPDFVREQLSVGDIDVIWWEEAERSRDDLETTLRRRYKWIGSLVFVGRGPGWLAIEDTGCKPRNWDAIGKIVEKRLKEFIASMEDPAAWREARDIAPRSDTSGTSGARKKPASQLDREIAEALSQKRPSSPRRAPSSKEGHVSWKGKRVPIDPSPRTIKPFERDRPYVVKRRGRLYTIVLDVQRGHVAHPAEVKG